MDARAFTTDHRMAEALLAWYDVSARALPWRAPPGAAPPAPYRVWLSEVMLQQTTVPAVIPYFAAFTARWPTVQALAAADEAEVMAAWAGLGYYARARGLIACARAVSAQEGGAGAFPDTEEALRALPGIGAYTAAAVAAIAFGRRAVVVDANVERVVSRLFAITQPLPGAKPLIRAATDSITPAKRAGDFAQGMMDLGAGICTPRAPRCMLCPLEAMCQGRAAGTPETLPIKAPKRPRPERKGRAYWITREAAKAGEVWLVRRAGKGMLGGMRALPDDGWSARADGDGAPPLPGPWHSAGEVTHTFTHFTLTLELMVYSGADLASLTEGEWWPLSHLAEAGLPSLFAKAASLATAREDQPHD